MVRRPKHGMAGPRRTRSGVKPRLVHLIWAGIILVLIPFACNFPFDELVSGEVPQPTQDEPNWIFAQPTRRATATPTPQPPEAQNQEPLVQLEAAPLHENGSQPVMYYTQAGDTLATVAVRYSVFPEEISSPEFLPELHFLNPGQLLLIPNRIGETTPAERILPDSEVVYSPSAIDFDIQGLVASAGGYLSRYREYLGTSGNTSGADIIKRVALENSINPKLLLALLEYRSGWVYGQTSGVASADYPMGYRDQREQGLYRQLVWSMKQISIGYYAWREGRLTELQFADGSTARLAPDLNAGTVGLQYLFAKWYDQEGMATALDPQSGLPALYVEMFGDPWARAQIYEPLFPPDLAQPDLILPFVRGQTWAFTGGPHGAWEQDGAWAALDFAPGSLVPGCEKSYALITAVAAGLVVRSERGVVVIDLDGDGYEQTGWSILYLHVESDGRVPVGTLVEQGDRIGHPSCEGGFSTGTHVHMARKYNGEWMPADGPIPFDLGGWLAYSSGVPYKGTLVRGERTVIASELGISASQIQRGPQDP